jgi:hypothetical protein
MHKHKYKIQWTIGLLIPLIISLYSVVVRATDLNYGNIHLLMKAKIYILWLEVRGLVATVQMVT